MPADSVYEFDVDDDDYTGDDSFSSLDLSIVEATFLGDRIVGEFSNSSDVTVQGPIGIYVACLSEDGTILGFSHGFADKDEADPGDTVPFQLSLYGDFDCSNFLVAGKGYSF